MKQLYFIRHGQSQMNVSGHYSGSTNTPLTSIGKAQAREAGKRARDQGLVFDIILASPLDRAHETAKLVAQEIDFDPSAILINDLLVERHFGALEGLHHSESQVNRDYYILNPYALDHIDDIETIESLQARADDALAFIHSLPQDIVLVTSHGSFGRALKRSINNQPVTVFGDSIDNAAIIKLI